MKIAREIRKEAERRHGCAPYEHANVITATGEEWEEIIEKKLAPVREALESCTIDHEFSVRNGFGGLSDDTIASVERILALLSDKDAND